MFCYVFTKGFVDFSAGDSGLVDSDQMTIGRLMLSAISALLDSVARKPVYFFFYFFFETRPTVIISNRVVGAVVFRIRLIVFITIAWTVSGRFHQTVSAKVSSEMVFFVRKGSTPHRTIAVMLLFRFDEWFYQSDWKIWSGGFIVKTGVPLWYFSPGGLLVCVIKFGFGFVLAEPRI